MKNVMKRSCLIFAVICSIAIVPVWAQKASEKVEKELMQLQDAWGEARIKGDIAFLDKLYAKEFRVNNISGSEKSREFDIGMFASGDLKPEIIKHEEMKVSAYGNVGIVTGIERLKGTYKGNSGEFVVRFTSIYVRREGRWQVVLHQGTEIRKPK